MADHASCDAPAVKPIKRADGKSEKQAAAEKAVGAAIDLLFVSLAHTFALVLVWDGDAPALAHCAFKVQSCSLLNAGCVHVVYDRSKTSRRLLWRTQRRGPSTCCRAVCMS